MSKFLDAALRYADMQWYVFPLRPRSKKPLFSREQGGQGYKDATLDKKQIAEWWAGCPDANIGVATGYSFWVLDIDVKSAGDETLESIERKFGKLPDTLQQVTGTGGRHYLFRMERPVKCSTGEVGQGIDVRGSGGYIVAEPSIHDVTLQPYIWDGMAEIENQAILSAPEWLYDLMSERHNNVQNAPAVPDTIPKGVQHNTLVSIAGTMRRRGMNANEIFVALMEVNKRCEQPGPTENIKGIADSMVQYAPHDLASGKIPMRKVYADLVDERKPELRYEDPRPDPEWRERLMPPHSQGDRPEKELANIETCLAFCPDYSGSIVYDEFGEKNKFTRDLLNGKIRAGATVDEQAMNLIAIDIKREFDIRSAGTMMLDAVKTVAKKNRVHPVREYLSDLKWDKLSRLDTWLSTYLGAPHNEYHSELGRRWLISAVARIMYPGCKADICPIMEGGQGLGKSTALAILGGEWYTELAGDLNQTNTLMALRGKWIVEIGELSAMSRADVNLIKSFMSRAIDTYREPWGKIAEDHPRQFIFCGTTNQDAYLKDETGNRRFWPIECNPVIGGMIDRAALIRDRDQLWAEAYFDFQDGQKWHVEDSKVLMLAKEIQSDRCETDPWFEEIAAFVTGKNEVRIDFVLKYALDRGVKDWTQSDKNRVGRTLKQLGFSSKTVRVDGVPTRTYVRG